MNDHQWATQRPPSEYDDGQQMPPRAANSGGASHDQPGGHVTETHSRAPRVPAATGGDA